MSRCLRRRSPSKKKRTPRLLVGPRKKRVSYVNRPRVLAKGSLLRTNRGDDFVGTGRGPRAAEELLLVRDNGSVKRTERVDQSHIVHLSQRDRARAFASR